MKYYFILSHLRIHNANAMSSNYTIGFPAITAWLGGMHALQRRINQNSSFNQVKFNRIGIVSHDYDLQTYSNHSRFRSLKGTSNPLTRDEERPPFVEEARIDLDVSLIIEVSGITIDDCLTLQNIIFNNLQYIKFAGGDIISHRNKNLFINGKDIFFIHDNEEDDSAIRQCIKFCMPGFVLIERKELLVNYNIERNNLDKLLDFLKVTYTAIETSEDSFDWDASKVEAGWIIPIVVGFKGLSKLSKVKNQRDHNKLHRFVEPIITLGEFKFVYHMAEIDEMMWKYSYDELNTLYLCKNE